ncbi:chemotaxis protein CheW [Marinomonas algicola]|uniref:chemotaxis protein CheW n=1 Tax=Marinomonas algicola TaxID=2773454 RepID=UPI001EFF5BF2|nr:chemotaxis protein CheW [Marinomonas algicola]
MKEFKPTEEDELIGPQLAVQRYLDELLQEATISHLNELANEDDTNPTEEENAESALESVSLDTSSSLTDSTEVDDGADESAFSTSNERLSLDYEKDGVEETEVEVDLSSAEPFSEMAAVEEESWDENDFDNLDAAFADFEAAVQDASMHQVVDKAEDSLSVHEEAVKEDDEGTKVDYDEVVLESAGKESDNHPDGLSLESEEKKSVAETADFEFDGSSRIEDVSLPSPVQPKRLRPTIKSDLNDLIDADNQVEDTAPVLSKTDPLPWAKSRFECLLFKVGGLKMAVPLVELGGIQKADKSNLTPLFGQPKWFLGVATVHDKHIRTVDTALWVMPNHYQGDLKENFKFVIQLDRSDWGLACEVVAEAITLEPSAVKWRSDRSKRPWLAGTVIEHMCAILDIQGFIELLNDPKNGFKAHLK